jgi:hypothetical protein
MAKKKKPRTSSFGEGQGAGRAMKAAATYSRWAPFEKAVLAKLTNYAECLTVIAQRQAQVDDDSNEADLVKAHLQKRLRDHELDPETCCVFFTTAELAAWVQEAIGSKLAINKTTPYLRTLGVAEMRYSKKSGVPGWVWRGLQARPGEPAKAFGKLLCDPGS